MSMLLWLLPSDRLPAHEPRRRACRAAGLVHEHALQLRQPVDHAEPHVAHDPERRVIVGKQAIEPVGHEPHFHRVEPPPALIALQHSQRPDVEAEPAGISVAKESTSPPYTRAPPS